MESGRIESLFPLTVLWPCVAFQGNAGVAQLVEQLICNQQVGGSSPFASLVGKLSLTSSYKLAGLSLFTHGRLNGILRPSMADKYPARSAMRNSGPDPPGDVCSCKERGHRMSFDMGF